MPLTIRIVPIPEDASLTRRQREQAAVASLITEILGAPAELAHTPEGAPFLPARPDLAISVTHSQTHAAVAIGAAGDIFGIDLEAPRPQLLRTASRFLSPHDILDTTRPRLTALLQAWTAKEAIYKALRAASLPLDAIRLNIPARQATVTANPLPATFTLTFRPAPDSQLLAIAHQAPNP